MNEEFDTKEFTIKDDDEIIEVPADDYKEDLTSFPSENAPTGVSEEVSEATSNNELEDLIVDRAEEETKKEEEKPKKSFKEKWKSLPKKKKTIIIISIILVLLIVGLILFLVLRDNKSEVKKDDKKQVVIEKDNYRYENGVLILLDSNDKEIGKYTCKNKDEKHCYVSYISNEDTFDTPKYIYEDMTEVKRLMPIINNKIAFIYDNKADEGMLFSYDIENNKVLDNYKLAKYYKIDTLEYIILENAESKYGLFKVEDGVLTKLIDFKYEYLGINEDNFKNYNILVGKKDDRYILVDETGKEVSKRISYPIKSFNDKHIVVLKDNKYSIVDYRNNLEFNKTYDYIMLLNDFVVGINDKSLSIYDYKENLLQQDDIVLPNDYYNKTYVYDKNNKLIDTKEAFWVIENHPTVTIEYYNNNNEVTSKVINVYEKMVSEKYDFISYYDGALYFYEDEAKTSLLGSYKCNSKNVIESANSSYDNCYIAKEKNNSSNELNSNKKEGYLPVIDKRYAFIYDTMSSKTPLIVLYDLKEEKALGKYTEVDAGIYSGSNSLTFASGSGLIAIVKSEKKDKYGLITFSNNKVSSVLAAEYASMERIGDYIQVKNDAGAYQLVDKNGSKLTGAFSGKIVNYMDKYVKVYENGKYSAYTFDVKEVIKNQEYLDLYSSYYVVINNHNLSIYEYNKKEAIGSIPIYQDDLTNAYQIVSAQEGRYQVKIKDQDGLETTKEIPSAESGVENGEE